MTQDYSGKNLLVCDVKKQYHALKDEIDEAIRQVLIDGQFINGVEVQQFSSALANYLDVKYVVPCASGTDALQLALMALNLNAGDEVILPSFGYAAAVEVVLLLGLKPIFVDVCASTFNIDASKIEDKITANTKVILPIHLFGQCADMEVILALALKYNLYVVEDAAQAIGAKYRFSSGEIKNAGTMGNVGCTSFFPSKNLSCFGDGGAVFSNDEQLFQRIKMIANHGQSKKYIHQVVGINSRLDTIQAAVLNVKLPHLDDFNERRTEIAQRYNAAFKHLLKLKTPQIYKKSSHIFHQYSVLLVDEHTRNTLQRHLESNGISTMVYYPLPLVKQPAYRLGGGHFDNYSIADTLSECILSLPIYPELAEEDQLYIINKVNVFFN